MNIASQDWLTNTLNPRFAPFVKQWRDSKSQPACQFLNWFINGEHLGHLDKQHLHTIVKAFASVNLLLEKTQRGVELNTQTNAQEFSAALMSVAQQLRAQGLVPGWRNEDQLLLNQEQQVLAQAERALFKTLGLRSRAVHVHVENHRHQVWVGVRANSKYEHPGMLDNLAAGGIASGETPESALWRELGEEAGLNSTDFTWMDTLPSNELVLSRPLLYGGWHHETVMLFRGQLKLGHRPCNRDGEVSAFQLMQPSACIEAINSGQFTPDAALCSALALNNAGQYIQED